jgi:hypothetical protein
MAFSPGQSGNPSGTKSKRPWTAALQRALAQYADPEKKIEAGEALRHIADDMVKKAVEGDATARDEIFNRLEGRPVQSISGPGGEDLFAPLAEAADAFRKAWRNE